MRQRPHYTGGIWKRSFISTVRSTVHTNTSPTQSFSKRSSNRRNLKTLTLCFSVDGKHFENGAFPKRWRHDNHVISLTEFSSNTNPKWPLIVAFLNSSGVVWTENIWCDVLTVKLPFSNSSGGVWTKPERKGKPRLGPARGVLVKAKRLTDYLACRRNRWSI